MSTASTSSSRSACSNVRAVAAATATGACLSTPRLQPWLLLSIIQGFVMTDGVCVRPAAMARTVWACPAAMSPLYLGVSWVFPGQRTPHHQDDCQEDGDGTKVNRR